MQINKFRKDAGRFLSVNIAILILCSGAMGATFKPGPFGAKSTLLSSPNAESDLQGKQPTAIKSPGTQVDTKYNVGDLSKFNCADLRRAALKMAVHASNLATRASRCRSTGLRKAS